MNKYFSSLVLLSHGLFFTQAAATTPRDAFAKLTPSITKGAQTWSKEIISTLSDELQLAYLNLFALNSESSIPALIKCAEYIESKTEMLPSSEKLNTNIMSTLNKYYENAQEKIARKKDLTEEQEETLWQKLEIKIQELVAYINGIYYATLYGSITKKGSAAPAFMFDANGIISQEKRTQSLPQPL